MRQIRARMPDEMIERIEQKAAEMQKVANCGVAVTFSDALRHLVTIGLQYSDNGHDGEPHANLNPGSTLQTS